MAIKDLKVITSLSCNKYCSFCSTQSSAKNKFFLHPNHLESVLKQDEYSTVFLEGGEPFLHPQIKELFNISINRPGKVAITTNSFPAEKTINKNPDKSLAYLVQKNKEYISYFDKPHVKFLLSINRELMRQGDNFLNALIMASSLENSKTLFNLRYYQNDEDNLINELSNYMSSYFDQSQINKMIRSSALYPSGRGIKEEQEMKIKLKEVKDLIAFFKFDVLLPDGKLVNTVYDTASHINFLLQQ